MKCYQKNKQKEKTA